MPSKGTIHPGPLESRFLKKLNELHQHRAVQRLAAQDPSLWSSDPREQEKLRQRLGWVSQLDQASIDVDAINSFKAEIESEGISHFLLLGMGGSSQAASVLSQLKTEQSGMIPHILNTVDPEEILNESQNIDLRKTLVMVCSKSGTTEEVDALEAYFWEKLGKGSQFIAVTDDGTPLHHRAKQRKYRRIFNVAADIGGRYSAMTIFGLLPASLSGAPIAKILRSAEEAKEIYLTTQNVEKNPAAQLSAMLSAAAKEGYEKLLIAMPPTMAGFGDWLDQLLAESTGKQGLGIVPFVATTLSDISELRDNKIVRCIVQSQNPRDHWLSDLASLWKSKEQPFLHFTVENDYEVASEMIRWMVTTAFTGFLLGINPFDEPDVVETKVRTTKLLSARHKNLIEANSAIFKSQNLVAVADPGLQLAKDVSLKDLIKIHVSRMQSHDYFALLAFLPMSIDYRERLARLRGGFQKMIGLATSMQFGPRYLHSSGQLHKGGPDKGGFLLLTRNPKQDVSIPGAEYSFGMLENIQAKADFDSLCARGRRILWLHFMGDPLTALNEIEQQLL